MKRCCHCGLIKGIEFFGKNKREKDGLNTRCKICDAESGRKSYHKDIERTRKRNLETWKRRYLIHGVEMRLQKKKSFKKYLASPKGKLKVKENYQKNKYYYMQMNKKREGVIRGWVNEKKNYPCKDCGLAFPCYVMDFDHVRGQKKFAIARSVAIWNRDLIMAEIEKCDLVCSNCHRIRTHNRREQKKRERLNKLQISMPPLN